MWSRSASTGSARSTMAADVPSSARARAFAGNASITRNTAQDSNAAVTAAARTPALACARCVLSKASDAIRSETVNPTPADAPAPVTEPHPTGGRNRPRVTAGTRHHVPAVAARLPPTETTRGGGGGGGGGRAG